MKNNYDEMFLFLKRYGYHLDENNAENIRFVGKHNTILILISYCSYEITCELIGNISSKSFSLQEGLSYCGEEKKGIYQFSQKDDIEMGIREIAKHLKLFFAMVNVSNEQDFNYVYDAIIKKRSEKLKLYEINEDLKRANECWKKGLYIKAKKLYKKNESYLSELQKKRYEYLKEHIPQKKEK